MDFKLIGSILLIVGTCIGAGMLALPIATAQLGFLGSLVLLFVTWCVMTSGAFLLLEVNSWMPLNSNIITMAKATTGKVGQIIAWVAYLLLLYSLLCAYISGGSDVFHSLALTFGVKTSIAISSLLFTLIFGLIVYSGIRTVDYTNRGLMGVKFLTYFLLVILLIPFISMEKLASLKIHHITSATALTVTITSFGYAVIVPSLRIYFAGDIKKLKTAIFIGSLIPLICYVAWDAAIMGIIPLNGSNGLLAILQSNTSTSDFVHILSSIVTSHSVTFLAKSFTSICMITSFLGVSLCLVDFLADGLQIEKENLSKLFLHALALLPPLGVVLLFPNAFISALEYAGIYTVILLILLPAWMAWRGRYVLKIANGFSMPGGKFLLIILFLFSAGVIIQGLRI